MAYLRVLRAVCVLGVEKVVGVGVVVYEGEVACPTYAFDTFRNIRW